MKKTWGGGSDSYFEYLIKHARLSNTDDNLFADTWHTAVDSSIKTLLKVCVTRAHASCLPRQTDGHYHRRRLSEIMYISLTSMIRGLFGMLARIWPASTAEIG
jgi:hypothetical protein